MSGWYFLSGKIFPATKVRPFFNTLGWCLVNYSLHPDSWEYQSCEFPHMCMLLRLNWTLKWALCRSPVFFAQFSPFWCSALMNSSHLRSLRHFLHLPFLGRTFVPDHCAVCPESIFKTLSGEILGLILFVSHFSGITGFYCLMLNNLNHCFIYFAHFLLNKRLNTSLFYKVEVYSE